jgi:hypothetical protein
MSCVRIEYGNSAFRRMADWREAGGGQLGPRRTRRSKSHERILVGHHSGAEFFLLGRVDSKEDDRESGRDEPLGAVLLARYLLENGEE